MKTYIRKAMSLAVAGLALASLPACESFLEVENPNSLETDDIDPDRDARLLSQSVYTRFIGGSGGASHSSLGGAYLLGAWFTNHARVGDTFPTRNDVGRRFIPNNTNETNAVWNYIHTNLQFARSTIASTEAAGPTIDLARDWFVQAFSIMQEAEYFCEGTIAENTFVSRRKMGTVELMDSAIVAMQKVQSIVAALPAVVAEGTALSTAAQVGIARAHLQAGRKAQASAAAALVPAGFDYTIGYIDNSTQRSLGNQMWAFSEARISLVVGPEFRAMADAGDTRIKYVNANRLAQDGELQFYRQNKFPNYGSGIRFASALEAQYIKEEADGNTATMLVFINTRRTAGAQGAYAGATDLASLMVELMNQKSRDFWLEGHDMRDFRRNPAIYPFVLPTGPNYYKTQFGDMGADLCWPVPKPELDNNKAWNTTG